MKKKFLTLAVICLVVIVPAQNLHVWTNLAQHNNGDNIVFPAGFSIAPTIVTSAQRSGVAKMACAVDNMTTGFGLYLDNDAGLSDSGWLQTIAIGTGTSNLDSFAVWTEIAQHKYGDLITFSPAFTATPVILNNAQREGALMACAANNTASNFNISIYNNAGQPDSGWVETIAMAPGRFDSSLTVWTSVAQRKASHVTFSPAFSQTATVITSAQGNGKAKMACAQNNTATGFDLIVYNDAGQPDSGWVQIIAIGKRPLPGTPALVSPTNNSLNQQTALTMSWGSAGDARSYTVQVSTSADFSSTAVNLSGLTATSRGISGLANGTTYYWRVNAWNGAGTGSWSSIWSFQTITALPATPVLSTPTNGATGVPTSATLSWGSVSGAAFYNCQISTVSNFSLFLLGNTTETSQIFNGLSVNKEYYWRVNASNGDFAGVWSGAWSFTTAAVSVLLPVTARMTDPSFSILNGSLRYTLPTPCRVEISLLNTLGRTVITINRLHTPGSYRIPLTEFSVSPGLYIARFKSANFEKSTLFLEMQR